MYDFLFYDGNPHIWKNSFYIETDSSFLSLIFEGLVMEISHAQ